MKKKKKKKCLDISGARHSKTSKYLHYLRHKTNKTRGNYSRNKKSSVYYTSTNWKPDVYLKNKKINNCTTKID